MPRVKGGNVARKRRKKVLKLAKGYFGSKSLLYRTANEQVMKSLSYAYRDRKQRNVTSENYGLQELMQLQDYTVYHTQNSSMD
jgi:ribosomal protein L20